MDVRYFYTEHTEYPAQQVDHHDPEGCRHDAALEGGRGANHPGSVKRQHGEESAEGQPDGLEGDPGILHLDKSRERSEKQTFGKGVERTGKRRGLRREYGDQRQHQPADEPSPEPGLDRGGIPGLCILEGFIPCIHRRGAKQDRQEARLQSRTFYRHRGRVDHSFGSTKHLGIQGRISCSHFFSPLTNAQPLGELVHKIPSPGGTPAILSKVRKAVQMRPASPG